VNDEGDVEPVCRVLIGCHAVELGVTGVSRTGYSADDGYYRVPDLLPATYEIRVELQLRLYRRNDQEGNEEYPSA
jgi:hypothetical protein